MVLPYLHRSFPALSALTPVHTALALELRRDIEVLATDIGPRGTFAPQRYRLAEEFLTAALVRAGYSVQRQAFEAKGVRCANLEAAVPGTDPRAQIVVVGAHYDSVQGCPAANDNASGVAGVLAIGRALRGKPGRGTVRFVLFANEEPPFFNLGEMGSQLYAKKCRDAGDDIAGMVCLETIGYYSDRRGSQQWPAAVLGLILPSVGDFVAMVGPASAKRWIQRAAALFEREQGFPMIAAAAPATIDQINWSDHRGFNEAGYPAFMVTDTAPLRYPHYHLPSDTPEKLDYDSMARVVHVLTAMVAGLADGNEVRANPRGHA